MTSAEVQKPSGIALKGVCCRGCLAGLHKVVQVEVACDERGGLAVRARFNLVCGRGQIGLWGSKWFVAVQIGWCEGSDWFVRVRIGLWGFRLVCRVLWQVLPQNRSRQIHSTQPTFRTCKRSIFFAIANKSTPRLGVVRDQSCSAHQSAPPANSGGTHAPAQRLQA